MDDIFTDVLNYTSDSVEFCPIENYESYFVVGSYTFLSDLKQRIGQINLYQILKSNSNSNLVNVKKEYELDLSGILDMKWSHSLINDKILLSGAQSNGSISVFFLDDTKKQLVNIASSKESSAICLSLDWNNKKFHNTSPYIVSSYCNGNLSLCDVNILSSSNVDSISTWKAHDLETWSSLFNQHNTNIIYSGADDCKFKGWDIRSNSVPIFINNSHTAGVTSIASHNFDENIIITGSYDEKLRFFDIRNTKTHLYEHKLNGGIWRIKFPCFSSYKDIIFCACMHNNFQIVSMNYSSDYSDTSLSTTLEYKGHSDLCYGIDWCNSIYNVDYLIAASCSFGDKLLKVFSVPVSLLN